MDEQRRTEVAQLEQPPPAAEPEPAAPAAEPPPERKPDVEVQPTRLLGELSRASESLAEVLDSLTAEKRELEARLERAEHELGQTRAEAAKLRRDASEQVERARDEAAAQLAATARDAARNRARAERAERLIELVGAERHNASFCATVGRSGRRRASREILAQAISDGVDVRLSAHHGWFDSLLVAEVEGSPQAMRQFLTWARDRFSGDDFREPKT